MPEIQNIFEDMYGNLKNESGLEEIMSAMKELVDQYVGNCKNGGFSIVCRFKFFKQKKSISHSLFLVNL